MPYSNEDKYVKEVNREPVFSWGDKSGTLVQIVNKRFAPGHWRDKDEATPYIQDLTGREIKSIKDALYKERNRHEEQIKAINNALEFMSDTLKADAEQHITFEDLLND